MTPAQELAARKAKDKSHGRRMGPRGRNRFPNQLRALRLALNLSMRDVAKACKISDATVYLAEQGCDIQMSTAFVLAKFYGKRIEEIWK